MWSAFRPKLRAQIRRPEKDGACCVDGSDELLDDFYGVFSRNMRDLGTPVYPKAWFAAILQAFRGASRLFVVYMNDVPVASGMTLGFRGTLEIPSASSLREFNGSAPNMLLYWSIIRYAIGQGYRVFDFGRTTRQSGPWHFKRQWGSTESPLSWYYLLAPGGDVPKLNPDNPKFGLAIRVWRNLPLPVANWLGPRIVRHLP
jgi:FemAB-related protein (PEP-CTERM system-associated)